MTQGSSKELFLLSENARRVLTDAAGELEELSFPYLAGRVRDVRDARAAGEIERLQTELAKVSREYTSYWEWAQEKIERSAHEPGLQQIGVKRRSEDGRTEFLWWGDTPEEGTPIYVRTGSAQPPGAWRSCADDPPPEWDFVLLHRPGPNQTTYLGGWYLHNDGRVLWTLDGRTGYGVEPPTHWMPLPASPLTKRACNHYPEFRNDDGTCALCIAPGKEIGCDCDEHDMHCPHMGKGS